MSILSLCLFGGLAAIFVWLAWGALAPDRQGAPRRVRRDNDRTAEQLFRDWRTRD